jgi:sporulation protein YlmC with PRC-barrel domain
MKKFLLATVVFTAFALPAFAQDATANADPACVIANSDGTKSLDTVKCKDGKPMDTTGSTAAQPAAPAASATTMTAIVSPDMLSNAKIMSANDFIGKTVYAPDGATVGEVNDFFVTDDGKVQAVVIGVGGFLGIGEKDVAVSMPAIAMQPDGDAVKLVINATKDELTAAPTYDRVKRVYVK